MPTRLQFRRGNTAVSNALTGLAGELFVDTEAKALVLHDGATAGGYRLLTTGSSGVDGLQNTNITSASSYANGAFQSANSSGSYANSAFSKANTSNILAQSAFDKANTGTTYGNSNVASYLSTYNGTINAKSIVNSTDYVNIGSKIGFQLQYDPTEAYNVYDIATGSWVYFDASGFVWQSNTTGTNQNVTLTNTGDITTTGYVTTNQLKTNLITNHDNNYHAITIDPNNTNLGYFKVDGWDDGGERVTISNQHIDSYGIYFYTEGGNSFRMYQNQFKFPDDTWQTTAFTGTAIDETARLTANAAFAQANTSSTPSELANGSFTVSLVSDGQLMIPQITQGGLTAGYITSIGNIGLNAQGNLWKFGADGTMDSPYNVHITTTGFKWPDNSTQNTAFTGYATDNTARTTANSSSSYANSAYVAANTADQRAVTSGDYANSAYTQSNTSNQRAVTSGDYANSAYLTANSAGSYANSAYIHANAAFAAANTGGAGTDTFARTQANSAFDKANTGTILAQAAFDKANTVTGTYGNSNVISLLSSFGSNTISTTGNVTANILTANNIVGTSANTTITAGAYVTTFDNTGTVTFPSFVKARELTSTQSSGDEGGQLNLAVPATNTSLANTITVDIYQNKFRIFDGGANAQGVSIDLSKTPNGVGGELLWKASGLVNAGADVTLGNLKARIPTTGNRSLQVSTVSGTYSVYGSDVYYAGGVGGSTISNASPVTITTTPGYLNSGLNFTQGGYTDTWTIMDTSNSIAWRITLIVGASFNNNMISIERLL